MLTVTLEGKKIFFSYYPVRFFYDASLSLSSFGGQQSDSKVSHKGITMTGWLWLHRKPGLQAECLVEFADLIHLNLQIRKLRTRGEGNGQGHTFPKHRAGKPTKQIPKGRVGTAFKNGEPVS